MQACSAYAGLGGRIPDDFGDIDLCKEYGIKFWELPKAPALHIDRLRFREAVRRQSEIDRAQNERS